MKTPISKTWIWLSVGIGALLIGSDRAAAESHLDFDGPVALALPDYPDQSVPPGDGLSFQLPPPPEPERESAGLVLLPVPAVDPPVLGPVAAQLPPPPGDRLAVTPHAPQIAAPELDSLFAGGSQSLVARAIGAAEGTRTASGQFTAAYYGHQDPGNQAWNLGTFSYQHGAVSPEAADAQQLARLHQQAQRFQAQAAAKAIALSQTELLNALDLANQAPVTALEWGYIDRLHQAKTMGLRGDEAILWARTRAFLDPDSGRWNAPGLGNTVQGISHDQERRMGAIALALAASSKSAPLPPAASDEEIADIVINLDLH